MAYVYMPNSSEHLTTLYWTMLRGMRKVLLMLKFLSRLFITFATAWLAHVSAHAGQALAVSAEDAQVAVSQGAFVLDVRSAAQFSAGHLPAAALLPADAAQRPLHELATLLSQAGADSSRTLLIVGEAGDANAHALWQRLAQVASGRVLWLVGGVTEWQMTGRALSQDTVAHKAVPQFLTPFEASPSKSNMAGGRVRSSQLLERNLQIKVAAL
jgi:3-mercaptopyruvate sulfurtransferase SseA